MFAFVVTATLIGREFEAPCFLLGEGGLAATGGGGPDFERGDKDAPLDVFLIFM